MQFLLICTLDSIEVNRGFYGFYSDAEDATYPSDHLPVRPMVVSLFQPRNQVSESEINYQRYGWHQELFGNDEQDFRSSEEGPNTIFNSGEK